MCGRFADYYLRQEISELYRIAFDHMPTSNFPPRYNIAPTQNSFVVRLNKGGKRELADLRWGLVPFWAKDLKIGSKMINCQSETADTKASFRAAFKKRRCLVVANGFFEWPEKDKPRFITLKEKIPFAFAGLWESWGPKEGDTTETFTILTTTPNDFMKEVHHRMPVMLAPDAWSLWLGEKEAPVEKLKELCKPFPSEHMTSWQVDPKVGNVRNHGPELVQHLQAL